MAVVVGSIVLALGGVILIGVGFAGLLGRLPRNRWAGVRTPSSLASDHAFTLANRVAGPAVLAGGTCCCWPAARWWVSMGHCGRWP